jgi:hypothetical protein
MFRERESGIFATPASCGLLEFCRRPAPRSQGCEVRASSRKLDTAAHHKFPARSERFVSYRFCEWKSQRLLSCGVRETGRLNKDRKSEKSSWPLSKVPIRIKPGGLKPPRRTSQLIDYTDLISVNRNRRAAHPML